MLQELESKFSPTANGVFMARWGPQKANGVAHLNKKLCLVATDKELLVETLFELSERPDCYFVKYSIQPKDGMYLGRCFLTDEVALGRLWQELKCHPRLMCTVQDDDFTESYRT